MITGKDLGHGGAYSFWDRVPANVRKVLNLVWSSGIEDKDRLAASLLAPKWAEKWAASNKWLSPSRGHLCVQRLIKGHCNGMKCWEPSDRKRFPFCDHREGFVLDRKLAVVVYHPYVRSWASGDLFALHSFADLHGLELRVSPFSYYYPGRTMRVEYWNPEALKKIRALRNAELASKKAEG